MKMLLEIFKRLEKNDLKIFYEECLIDLNIKKFLKKQLIIEFQHGYIFTEKFYKKMVYYILDNQLKDLRIGQALCDASCYYITNKEMLNRLIINYNI